MENVVAVADGLHQTPAEKGNWKAWGYLAARSRFDTCDDNQAASEYLQQRKYGIARNQTEESVEELKIIDKVFTGFKVR